ncbi:MAG: DUF2147 domain-containing protein [Chitinophagaceae bacterium]
MSVVKNPIIPIALVTTILLSYAGVVRAQADQIEGLWFNEKKDAKIQVYKDTDGKFYGKIVWLKEPKLDEKNPKSNLKSRPIIGLVILKGCEKDGKTYDDGTIYDPENGKTYDCTITNKGNTLALRGYIGISLFGRTTEWERADRLK